MSTIDRVDTAPGLYHITDLEGLFSVFELLPFIQALLVLLTDLSVVCL